jgi:hypothetical protein
MTDTTKTQQPPKILDGDGVVAGEKQEEGSRPISDFDPAPPEKPLSLRDEAEKIVRDYFLKRSKDFIKSELSEAGRTFLANFAARGLVIAPQSWERYGVVPPKIIYSPCSEFSVESVRSILRATLGDYAEQVDLYKSDKIPRNFGALLNFLPELNELKDVFFGQAKNIIPHYAIVLNMNAECRDLAIIGLNSRKKLPPLLETQSQMDFALSEYLSTITPTLAEIGLAAQTFGVTDISDTLLALTASRNFYFEKYQLRE